MDINKLIMILIEIEKREIPDDCGMAMFTLYTDGTSCISVEDMTDEARDIHVFRDVRGLEDFITTE